MPAGALRAPALGRCPVLSIGRGRSSLQGQGHLGQDQGSDTNRHRSQHRGWSPPRRSHLPEQRSSAARVGATSPERAWAVGARTPRSSLGVWREHGDGGCRSRCGQQERPLAWARSVIADVLFLPVAPLRPKRSDAWPRGSTFSWSVTHGGKKTAPPGLGGGGTPAGRLRDPLFWLPRERSGQGDSPVAQGDLWGVILRVSGRVINPGAIREVSGAHAGVTGHNLVLVPVSASN